MPCISLLVPLKLFLLFLYLSYCFTGFSVCSAQQLYFMLLKGEVKTISGSIMCTNALCEKSTKLNNDKKFSGAIKFLVASANTVSAAV